MKPTHPNRRRESRSRLVCNLIAWFALAALAVAPAAHASVYVPFYRLWPDGVVPFEWDPGISFDNRLRVIAAMNIWKEVANVDFVFRTAETDYVLIQNAEGSNGSSSPKIGREGGQQNLYIRQDLSNITVYGLAHELGHVLGFYHTHQRVDRDEYVTWYEERTNPAKTGNFVIEPLSLAYPRNAMDFDSVMSYGRCIFAICDDCGDNLDDCRVLEINDPADAAEFDTRMGQRAYLTRIDALVMSFLYPKPDWRFVEAGYQAPLGIELGTFHFPFLTLNNAVTSSPDNATVWVQPGTYQVASGTLDKPLTLRAPLGEVLLTSN